jgi:hypothetical protein
MILNSAPANEAVLSNVGQINSFNIKATAKSFHILSSGLYANKIRAIIRELSCNAVDSHVAAGKKDTPYDVHLPSTFEPWFSVRDYGTGLSHNQVTGIFTTFFESTKTDSNDYVGALGLGSKSPFSYTDNFTVTAIKDGVKGIYTAFINDSGVPSIALMTSENTTEANGVEIKFSVNERYDFDKFRQEAEIVYRYFEKVPNVKGNSNFAVKKPEYETVDIIPGVHSYKSDHATTSRAIMGNIAYPIDVPNAEKNLGPLVQLLKCGIEMHFNIGELDFQASREGLSYIQSTIDAIKKKLEALNASLSTVVASEANKIDNLWERSIFLFKKKRETLWNNAVTKYVADTKFPLFDQQQWSSSHSIDMDVKEMQDNYNIGISSFHVDKHSKTCRGNSSDRYSTGYNTKTGMTEYANRWRFHVDGNTTFIKQDTKLGALERAKYHMRNRTWDKSESSKTVFLLTSVDKTKPAKYDDFFKAIHNPPDSQIELASALLEKPRAAGIGRNVNILQLTEKTKTQSWRDTKYLSWSPADTLDKFDDSKTYYYAPLSGFSFTSKVTNKEENMHDIATNMQQSGIPALKDIIIYGVRKGDMDAILAKKNWVNIEDHLVATLKVIDQKVILGIVKSTVATVDYMRYNDSFYKMLKPTNEIAVLHDKFKQVQNVNTDRYSLEKLSRIYAKNAPFDASALIDTYRKQTDAIYKKYPLLSSLYGSAKSGDVAEYINLMDAKHGY